MQVNLNFDTEKEDVSNLKKLVEALQQLIASREGVQFQASPVVAVQSSQPQKAPTSQTSGGCRVIPYEDMSGKMTNIFSGRRI